MRLAVVLAALAATTGMAYRAFHDELALRANTAAARQAIDLADRALTTSADLRAALHAYVAPGQGSPFWVSRSAVLLEELQAGLTSLAAMDPDAAPIAAEPITKLLAAEKRARGFLRDNQELLASDVIFTEGRDQLDAIRLQIAAARDRDLAAADGREAGLRREQYLLLAAILGVWMLCALLLMPVAETAALVTAPKVTTTGTDDMLLAPFDYAQGSPDPSTGSGSSRAESRGEQGRGAPPPAPVVAPEPVAPQPVLVKAPPPPFDFAQGSPDPSTGSGSSRAESRGERGRGAPPVPRLPEAAQVCADMARVSDGEQIASLLARAADVLDATGLIVWVTSADGTSLVPAAHCGYDERLLARVGALPLDSENLTAAAFRDGARRTTSARSGAPAAIAVPLVGPSGAIGVLSGEVRHVERVGETTSALASIFAAQLATLVGSMPPAESAEPPAEQITK